MAKISKEKNNLDFCLDIRKEIRQLVTSGSSFTLIGMPFVGLSSFLRFLTTTDDAYYVYLDTDLLQHRKKEELFLQLYKELGGKKQEISYFSAFDECKRQLKKLLVSQNRIVILLTRIDYFNYDFLHEICLRLKALENLGNGKIIFIIGSSRLLQDIDEDLPFETISFLAKPVYFRPLEKNDLKKLLAMRSITLKQDARETDKLISLSGGHYVLSQLLLKTESVQHPLSDALIKLHLKLIYDMCTTEQKSQLKKIANGKIVAKIDPALVKIGMVKKWKDTHELFSPLYQEYIATYVHLKLPRKERKLFSLLKKKLGKLVTKEEIFDTIWEKDSDNASEWALNALIYRIRKNATFHSLGYLIENEKNIGYRLLKEPRERVIPHKFTERITKRKRVVYTLWINCPDIAETINRIIDAAAEAGAGKKGEFRRVAFVVRGQETWVAGEHANHYVGVPGAVSVGPTARITMQCYREFLKPVISAIMAVHPYEEPVVEVTKLEKESVFPSSENTSINGSLDSCSHCAKYPVIKTYTDRILDR